MKANSKKIALSGILAAFSITTMLLGNFIPLAAYMTACISALFIIPVVYEYHFNTAFSFYCSVCFLALLFVPNKEVSFMYVFCFGLYAVIKQKIDRRYNKIIKIILKLLFVNLSLIVCYSLLIIVFPVDEIIKEFLSFTPFLFVLFIALFNFTFLLYDKLLQRLTAVYVVKFRKKIFSNK